METEAQKIYNALKDNPEKIIEWAKREIEEYEKLIELLTTVPVKLTPLHKCLNFRGHWYSVNNPVRDIAYCMSIRLYNIIKSHEINFDKRPIYYETASFKEMIWIRNFGKKTWDEFAELRKNFIVTSSNNLKT